VNTRTIGQTQLSDFREAIEKRVNDPYQVLLQRHKLPMSLLTDSGKTSRMHLLDTETFDNTFGPKCQRKRPKLQIGSVEDMAKSVTESQDSYKEDADSSLQAQIDLASPPDTREWYERAGQSRRIWGELYKVGGT
jgi:nuclear GTP-binding protein